MNTKEYYSVLIDNISSDLTVSELYHGVAWTAARLSNGAYGVAMHCEGDSRPRMFPSLIGMPVKLAAEAIRSWNLEEADEAMAAVNAYYNTAEHTALYQAEPSAQENGTLFGVDLSDKIVGFVGHLVNHKGSITEEMLSVCRQYYILEREPKPGDYPDSAAEFLLPACDIVVITGSAAMNKTIPRVLELSKHAEIYLTGPSVTLCPELRCFGIRRLHGSYITDGERMIPSIMEKRSHLHPYSRRFMLDL